MGFFSQTSFVPSTEVDGDTPLGRVADLYWGRGWVRLSPQGILKAERNCNACIRLQDQLSIYGIGRGDNGLYIMEQKCHERHA